MICWELIWGYYRRNWWHWVYCVFLCFMWLFVFSSAKLDFKFFIVLLAMQHPLNMEQVGDVYRKLPISRPTLVRTLNLHGICLDVIVFSGLMLLTDLIWWLAGNNIQPMLWSQSFWLAILLILRCLFHILAMRTAFAPRLGGNGRYTRPNNASGGSLMVVLMVAFVGCNIMLKEFTVTPGIAILAGVGASLACWKTTRAVQSVMEKTLAPKPARKTKSGFIRRQRLNSTGNYLLRGVVAGCAILLILLLLMLGTNRKGLDAFQLLPRVMQETLRGGYNVFFFALVLLIAGRTTVWIQSMRLLRCLPWNARQHNWFIVRQFVSWDLGFMMPWFAAMLITVTPNQKLLLLPLVGACGLCFQLGYLWLSLLVARPLMEALSVLFFSLLAIVVFSIRWVFDAFFNEWTVLSLGVWAFLAGALCLWLFRAIERAICSSSISYRRPAG